MCLWKTIGISIFPKVLKKNSYVEDKEIILTSILFSRFEFGAMVAMTWYTMDMLIH